jgi:lipopolysaccharide/colanic/teichoic acid biosynthesis glycosyltransferase
MLQSLQTQPAFRPALISRRRFQLLGALFFAAVVPFLIRTYLFPGTRDVNTWNSFVGNSVAVMLALWGRLSVGNYPGVRSSALNLPTASISHAAVLAAILLLRVPYDRVGLLAGFGFHLLWLFFVYFALQRVPRRPIGIIPFGAVTQLGSIDSIDWVQLTKPSLEFTSHCEAIVADFDANLPAEWESFLAEAALAGRLVYQVKQLSESLTGRVEIQHISENSFGSLVPSRGFFYVKELADFILALFLLPVFAIIVMFVAIAIRCEGPGSIFFRQRRVGFGGRPIEVIKFRTMMQSGKHDAESDRDGAMTIDGDPRITRAGAFLRRTRLDELPQILNVLKGEMSWIGPRPEAEVLSSWYRGEVPFYSYRHVVKPGISGWAAVSQGHVSEVDDIRLKLQYDFYYIKYFSLWLDVLIVFRTIKTIVTGFGHR